MPKQQRYWRRYLTPISSNHFWEDLKNAKILFRETTTTIQPFAVFPRQYLVPFCSRISDVAPFYIGPPRSHFDRVNEAIFTKMLRRRVCSVVLIDSDLCMSVVTLVPRALDVSIVSMLNDCLTKDLSHNATCYGAVPLTSVLRVFMLLLFCVYVGVCTGVWWPRLSFVCWPALLGRTDVASRWLILVWPTRPLPPLSRTDPKSTAISWPAKSVCSRASSHVPVCFACVSESAIEGVLRLMQLK